MSTHIKEGPSYNCVLMCIFKCILKVVNSIPRIHHEIYVCLYDYGYNTLCSQYTSCRGREMGRSGKVLKRITNVNSACSRDGSPDQSLYSIISGDLHLQLAFHEEKRLLTMVGLTHTNSPTTSRRFLNE
jgi:hypothetical protein